MRIAGAVRLAVLTLAEQDHTRALNAPEGLHEDIDIRGRLGNDHVPRVLVDNILARVCAEASGPRRVEEHPGPLGVVEAVDDLVFIGLLKPLVRPDAVCRVGVIDA